MSVMLEGLKYRNAWVSRLGALKGCMDYLGKQVSEAWLYGATGHAFILNVAPDACPSGPTAWNCEMLTNLAHNLGVNVKVFNAWRREDDFSIKQKIAWENTKRALDKGYPCYGWELGIPEFYVICGYDEYGYYYKGFGTPTLLFTAESSQCGAMAEGPLEDSLRQVFAAHSIVLPADAAVSSHPGYVAIRSAGSDDVYYAMGPVNGQVEIHDDYVRPSEGYKPWDQLGCSDVGWLHTGWLENGALSDDFTVVTEALEFALEFAQSPGKWVMPGYQAGLGGYDNWLNALQSDYAGEPAGLAYNGEVWAECRMYAELFLKEAAERIGGEAGRLLLDAAELYGEVAASLKRYQSLLPFYGKYPGMQQETHRKEGAIQAVKDARLAEARGLEQLKKAYAYLERTAAI
jgi:hypothetical protein